MADSTIEFNPIRITIAVLALALIALLVVTHETPADYTELLYEQRPADAESVLLVGNSHARTAYVPQMLQRIAHDDERHPPLWIDIRAPGGWTLGQHVANETVERNMADGNTDYVVLQGQSLEPLFQADIYLRSFEHLAITAQDLGAEPILFQTWPRHPDCESYRELSSPPSDPYQVHAQKTRLATEAIAQTSARHAPVAQAWEAIRTSDAPLDLYAPDGNHANHRGAYLTALVLYGTIIDDGLPDEPWHPPELSSSEVGRLLETANEALNQ